MLPYDRGEALGDSESKLSTSCTINPRQNDTHIVGNRFVIIQWFHECDNYHTTEKIITIFNMGMSLLMRSSIEQPTAIF